MGMALGTNSKFYINGEKRLEIKVRKFWGLIPTFVKVTGEKLLGGLFWPLPILNRVNDGTPFREIRNRNFFHSQKKK